MFGRLVVGALIIGITAVPIVAPVVSAAPAILPPRPAPVPDELRPDAPAWAWCGVDPAAPDAAAIVGRLARDSGIDVTFGACLRPTGN